MGVVFAAVGAADAGVFHKDFTLFFVVELSKVASAPERIPDGPGPVGIQDIALRTVDEGFVQIRFVSGGIRAAEHGEVGAMVEACEGRAAEEVAGFVGLALQLPQSRRRAVKGPIHLRPDRHRLLFQQGIARRFASDSPCSCRVI